MGAFSNWHSTMRARLIVRSRRMHDVIPLGIQWALKQSRSRDVLFYSVELISLVYT